MLNLHFYDSDENRVGLIEHDILLPNICANCKHTGEQKYLNGILFPYENDNEENRDILLVTACQYCFQLTQHFFIEKYNDDIMEMEFELLYTIPDMNLPIVMPNISMEIQEKFPEFFAIFNQSKEAEDRKLGQLAGMGYRKSLEFLITDFLLEYLPNGVTEEWLKNPSTSLSQKISKLPNERIQKLSKAITYIGNDETHYTRRHPEHDVSSIKTFISALLSDMNTEIILRDAEKLLNKPKS